MTPPRIPLRKHQLAALDFARNKPASLLGLGMGCGKTAIALALADDWGCDRILVVCPTSVRAVWRGQIPKHSFRPYHVAILDHGSVAQRTKQAKAAWRGSPLIVVVNYEATWREPFRTWCLGQPWDLAILDESQRVMRETHVSVFANELRKVSERRTCLTGTPLTQDPLSVFGQCRFLDPSVFGEDLTAFTWKYQNRYVVGARKALAKCHEMQAARGEPLWYPPEGSLQSVSDMEEYLERLSRIAYRVENTVLDLPPLTVERRTFTLSSSARSIYEAIKNGYGEELETGRWPDVRGSYAITMRLQQITSGWLPDQEGKIIPVDPGKAQCLTDILTEAGGEPVVVFTRFTRDLEIVEQIAKRLGLRYGEISGHRRDGLSSIGTMTDGLQVCGVEEEAGGAGIDLSRARIAVDYSPSWKRAVYDQKLARVYRPPQTRPVSIYQLMAEDTIDAVGDKDTVDQEIHRALDARKAVIGQVWGGLAEIAVA